MKINAIVFDMDGLLVDTEPLWKNAEKELIESRGAVFDNEIRKHIIGMRSMDIVAYFADIYSFDDDLEALHRELEARMLAQIEEQLIPKPGAQELLEALQAKGVPCALASSSTKVLIEAVLKKQGWESYFSYYCSAEHENAGKPAPDVYLTACALLAEAPEYCLALEDSLNGAKAAVAAEMPCYVIPSSDVYPDPAFDDLKVEQFKNLLEIIPLLGA